MSSRLEQAITYACILVTGVLYIGFIVEFIQYLYRVDWTIRRATEIAFFSIIVLSFLWGNFLYQFARLGYIRRCASGRPLSRNELERCYNDPISPALTVLIPSYKEEIHVLRQTILSAALMEHPQRRIVVLIDNPPDASGRDLSELQATRRMIRDLNRAFAELAKPLEQELERFLRSENRDMRSERRRLSRLYTAAATCLDAWIGEYSTSDATAFAHHDRLFVERVLKALAADHRNRAIAVLSMPPERAFIARESRRLAALFKVEITSFERKCYENLSHEPNKAMNLNSYIGLMGRSFQTEIRKGDRWLIERPAGEGDLSVPESEYVLTLDADSVVLPDYALRLTQVMEANPRTAVAQTPYSAFPGAPNSLERAAGATTDLQYIVHQGFTSGQATYWVGANAVLRLKALRDIEQTVIERGHPAPVFIQDRTVIEDTGSTVDLISRGWRLFNYPSRLAYSATPPDFGSLVIQRRRWANGGLIILPELLRHLRTQFQFSRMQTPGAFSRAFLEAFMRVHYLCSPALSSFGLLAILLYPFDENLTTAWLVATAIPYYFLYGRDLRQCGYQASDVFQVYALILLMLSANLSGVARSAQQMATGRKSAFGRTPKISGRTASPPHHILFQGLITAYLVAQSGVALHEGSYGHAAFAIANAAAYLYALTCFVGWSNAWIDLTAQLIGRKPQPSRAVKQRYPSGAASRQEGV
jgi:cellulose synthase/poly-beta-1,6-N-acetylglucosamine synthase-like glycosyltransferase